MKLVGDYEKPETCRWIVNFSNGAKRYYTYSGKNFLFLLDREEMPNGLYRHFHYDKKNKLREITTKNQDGSLELNKIEIATNGFELFC